MILTETTAPTIRNKNSANCARCESLDPAGEATKGLHLETEFDQHGYD